MRSPVAAPLSVAAAVGADAARVVGVVLALPVRILSGAERALGNLDEMAVSVHAMHGEFVGMRVDIRDLGDHVVGLREDLVGLRGDVTGLGGHVGVIGSATESLDGRMADLATKLEAVNALASRFSRLGQRRVREPGHPAAGG